MASNFRKEARHLDDCMFTESLRAELYRGSISPAWREAESSLIREARGQCPSMATPSPDTVPKSQQDRA